MDEDMDFSIQGMSRRDDYMPQISSSLTSDFGANEAFQHFVERVHKCRRCPRMEGRTRVLGLGNGLLEAQLLFRPRKRLRLG